MKNRIETKFDQLNGEKALITFITGGDPDFETTKKLVYEMIEKGVDLIEIGVPFSDPIAEGPVIQAANERAISNGANIERCFEFVAELRKEIKDFPFVFLLYYNCIFQYGNEAFFEKCSTFGVDGVIIPDLPHEEKNEITAFTDKYNILHIPLVAPTSNDRIQKIVKDARGFIYCVSSLGVTGIRQSFYSGLQDFTATIKAATDVPICIGFGISSAEQVFELKNYCDGVIIGSKIVNMMAEEPDKPFALEKIGKFTREIKAALA